MVKYFLSADIIKKIVILQSYIMWQRSQFSQAQYICLQRSTPYSIYIQLPNHRTRQPPATHWVTLSLTQSHSHSLTSKDCKLQSAKPQLVAAFFLYFQLLTWSIGGRLEPAREIFDINADRQFKKNWQVKTQVAKIKHFHNKKQSLFC